MGSAAMLVVNHRKLTCQCEELISPLATGSTGARRGEYREKEDDSVSV